MRKQVKPKPHTPGQPGEYAEPGAQAVRPRDAATLIIVRQLKTPKILLGKRAASHKFMPNKFVSPAVVATRPIRDWLATQICAPKCWRACAKKPSRA